MRLLVTGGAGFIGSHFVKHMLNKYSDCTIINLDKVTYAGNPKNLLDIAKDPRYQFVRGDITVMPTVTAVVQTGVDAIVNFAAESHVDRSIDDPAVFIKTNVLGTQCLLDAARANDVSRFIQVSTDEVYGSLGPVGAFHELSPLQPSSPYSASKAAADLLLRAYVSTYRMPAIITRCSNNYGPYQFPEKLIPRMIIRAWRNQSLPIYGDGQNIRDWVYVEDHCAAIDQVLRSGRVGEVYNIGGSFERSNLDVVREILAYLNRPEGLIRFVDDRPGHDRRYAVDTTKIAQQLHWTPSHSFENGLRKTIDWYINNEWWWRELAG